MNRATIDRIAQHYRLPKQGAELLLQLSGAQRGWGEWRQFLTRVLNGIGVTSLAGSVLFFIAANWQRFDHLSQFFGLVVLFVLCIGLALWKPAPQRVGRYALLGAIVCTGALCTWFGISYQTGANTYELFFYWALLSAAFAFAARSNSAWGLWWGILCTALLLLGMTHIDSQRWWFERVEESWNKSWLVPTVVCAIAHALFCLMPNSWLPPRRQIITKLSFVSTIAFASLLVIHNLFDRGQTLTAASSFLLLAFIVYCGYWAWLSLKQRADVFELAAMGAGAIAISTTLIAKLHGGLFGIAFWIILSSAALASGLLALHRSFLAQRSAS